MLKSIAAAAASLVYGAVTTGRNAVFDIGLRNNLRITIPIICVGNATVGGNGKTPVTQYLCRLYLDQGRRPVILTRGYGGRVVEPTLVDANHSAADVGDEALQHMTRFLGDAHVVVARNREQGAEFIERYKLGDVILLDDGYQRRGLYRNINLLLIDVSSKSSRAAWNSGRLLPWGTFRERRISALQRASAIILVKRVGAESEPWETLQGQIKGLSSDVPIVCLELVPTECFDALTFELAALTELQDEKVVTISAIAKPDGFVEVLSGLGAKVIGRHDYPDHYLFRENDFQAATAEAELEEALLFSTEKDLVKLREFLQTPKQLFVLRLGVKFRSSEDDKILWRLLDGV